MPASKSLDGVDPELQERTRLLLAAVPGSWIASAWRSYQQQVALYKNYLAGGNLAAKPGTSNHEKGLAVDVNGNYTQLRAQAKQCGLHDPIKGEPWHYQLAPKRIPLDSAVIPSITITDHGDIDLMNLRTITFSNVQLDSSGCGWVPVDVPADRILDITQQGHYPPADGYAKDKVQFGKQHRTIPGTATKSVVEIVGGKRKEVISFFVQVAA